MNYMVLLMKSRKRWEIKEQARLFNRLGYLLNRGYTLATAIEFLMLYVNEVKKHDLQFIILKLKQGAPFYKSFDTLQFSNDGLGYIYFAEKYGDLAKGLLNAGKMLEMKETYKKRAVKVIRYPLFLMIFLSIVIALMQKVIIPQFLQLYQSMNLPPSMIISLILFLDSSIPIIGLILLLFLALLIIAYFRYFRRKTALGKNIFLCKVPFIRYVVKKYNTYYFSFHLGNLLENGLSINEALIVFDSQGQIPFFQEEAKRLRAFLVEGDELATILQNTTYYDKELAPVIIHGQANGILSNELLEYSSMILDEFEETFAFWLRILQPTMMLLIAVTIVVLYAAVMLPIYGMMQTL